MENSGRRFICIHGHFYQPPRENAWLETIDHQPSATPFHDWNDRIHDECYKRNAWARIQNNQNQIVEIVNNYEWISFNFGPTLLSWLEMEAPETYARLIEADQNSAERLNGHGNAMAQVYSHLIMPLANERDKRTQVIWGIKDFESRFGRKPEGMWLAETAADVPSLEIMAEFGIKFTVLAPGQAAAVMNPEDGNWMPVTSYTVDTSRPYKVSLPSGKSIAVFFYNGDISQEVAFNGLLHDGAHFASRIMSGFSSQASENALMHIATDGETYGHHHQFGEMALADAIQRLKKEENVELTNYAAYLAEFPPVWEAKIVEPSSWSCAHGVERWNSNCGCHTGGREGWNQEWRGPLRKALDFVRDTLAPFYEKEARFYVKDPWNMRDEYIKWVLEKDLKGLKSVEGKNVMVPLSEADRSRLLKLLEMQRQCILMYTSCGWFFNEVSGIETLQILQYAYRAISLAEELGHAPLLERWGQKLFQISSNKYQDGLEIFREKIAGSQVDFGQFASFNALSTLWSEVEHHSFTNGFSISFEQLEKKFFSNGKAVKGRILLQSRFTLESKDFAFVVWVDNDLTMQGRLTEGFKDVGFEEDWFGAADLKDLDLMEGGKIELADLYHEHQLILSKMMERSWQNQKSKAAIRMFETFPLKELPRFYGDEPVPQHLEAAARDFLEAKVKAFLKSGNIDLEELEELLPFKKQWKIGPLDNFELGQIAGKYMADLALHLESLNEKGEYLETLMESYELFTALGMIPEIWEVQNIIFDLKRRQGFSESSSEKENFWNKLLADLKVSTESPVLHSTNTDI
jgi:hypothetical protein